MAQAIDNLTSFRFSTAELPPRERLSRWYEVFGRTVARRLLSLPADGLCHVDTTVRAVPSREDGVVVQRARISGGVSALRTRALLADGNDDIVLCMHETGRRRAAQLGREADIAAGGGLLLSNADISSVVLPDPARYVSIAVPRKAIRALAPGVEDALARPLPPHTGVLRLLLRYVVDILEDEEALQAPGLGRAVAGHIHDLCALAVGATRDAAEIAKGRGLRAARLRAVKAEIARNLADGDLSAATIAERQRISTRYIHRLFESEGTTMSRYVLGLRLTRVHRVLADPNHAEKTIGAIAYDAGFGDLSTFNRAFRRRFGASPSDVRAMSRQA